MNREPTDPEWLDILDLLAGSSNTHVKQGLVALETRLAKVALKPGQPPAYPQRSEPAFDAFLQTQEAFDGNATGHLLHLLRRLIREAPGSKAHKVETQALIQHALLLLQGCVLLHRPSQQVFIRQANLQLLLDLVAKAQHETETRVTALTTLVCCLVDQPASLRVFEQCGGVGLFCDTFKAEETPHAVKLKMLEFFYFYLMPEVSEEAEQSAGMETVKADGVNEGRQTRTVRKVWSIPKDLEGVTIDDEEGTVRPVRKDVRPNVKQEQRQSITRTRAEKEGLLGEHLSNVSALVASFDENTT